MLKTFSRRSWLRSAAGMAGARPVTLSTPVLSNLRIEPLTLRHWEGREVWRRSVGLVFDLHGGVADAEPLA